MSVVTLYYTSIISIIIVRFIIISIGILTVAVPVRRWSRKLHTLFGAVTFGRTCTTPARCPAVSNQTNIPANMFYTNIRTYAFYIYRLLSILPSSVKPNSYSGKNPQSRSPERCRRRSARATYIYIYIYIYIYRERDVLLLV